MTDENYSFAQARTRLEEIVAQVRKKDLSLEKSLDLLEEGVRLANICTEQSDHTEWRSVISEEGEGAEGAEGDAPKDGEETAPAADEASAGSDPDTEDGDTPAETEEGSKGEAVVDEAADEFEPDTVEGAEGSPDDERSASAEDEISEASQA
jgi:exodeoxyribonuclease VII small subunit